ncbi:MAG TPA: hypothetical protein VLW17_10160, partial [Thermoanaerobaculaceae bacterium]|nr:hypothetical protein [Thermoanaerobaculaceae bacterium]
MKGRGDSLTFTSQFFLFGFLPAVLAATMLAPARARLAVLTLASYGFCAWAGPVFILPLAAITAIDYACSRVIAGAPEGAAGRRRLALAASTVANLGMLVAFKYLGFFAANLDALLARLGLARTGLADAVRLALPLGISFYAFQSLGYVIDVYHRRTEPARSLLEYACFLSFFPRLAAGPIVRFKEFAPRLRAPAVGLASFSRG